MLTRAMLAALALAACGDKNDEQPGREAADVPHPREDGREPKRRPSTPGCQATVSPEGDVSVGGVKVGLRVPDAAALVTFAAGPGRVLLAERGAASATPREAPAPSAGRLYVAHCVGMPPPRVLLERPEADFGHAVESPDGTSLYFTDADGAWALDLTEATPTPARLTTPRDLDAGCWRDGDPAALAARRDVVRAVDPESGALLLERGAPCGYGGVWVSTPVWLMDPALRTESPLRPVHQVATVAADAAGRLWLGDAGRCDEPGPRDEQTPGAIFRSDDQGLTWRRVPVVADDAPMSTAAAVIRADSKRRGYLVVLSARCTSPAGTYGGQLYTTRDGGATWQRPVLPEGAGLAGEEGPAAEDVARVAGSVDRLHVWGGPGEVWRSNSSGLRWKRADAAVGPPPPHDTARLGGAVFRASTNGLLRVTADGKETIVFPAGPAVPPLPASEEPPPSPDPPRADAAPGPPPTP